MKSFIRLTRIIIKRENTMHTMKRISLRLVLLLSLIATPVQAAVYSWMGVNDSAWDGPGNWSVNLVPVASFPDANDIVMFFTFSPNTTI